MVFVFFNSTQNVPLYGCSLATSYYQVANGAPVGIRSPFSSPVWSRSSVFPEKPSHPVAVVGRRLSFFAPLSACCRKTVATVGVTVMRMH